MKKLIFAASLAALSAAPLLACDMGDKANDKASLSAPKKADQTTVARKGKHAKTLAATTSKKAKI